MYDSGLHKVFYILQAVIDFAKQLFYLYIKKTTV